MKNITVSVTDKTYAAGRKWAAPPPRSIFRALSDFFKNHAETVQPKAVPIKSIS
jgi:hypothetical protein